MTTPLSADRPKIPLDRGHSYLPPVVSRTFNRIRSLFQRFHSYIRPASTGAPKSIIRLGSIEEYVPIPLEAIQKYIDAETPFLVGDERIGEGQSSVIYSLTDKEGNPTSKVIKIIKPSGEEQKPEAALSCRGFNPTAGDQLTFPIRHPSIVCADECLYLTDGVISPVPTRGKSQILAVIMPHCMGTPLSEMMGKLSMEQVRSFSFQLANAISHLNAGRVLHGDLNSDNILIVDEEKVALLDFSLAHKITSDLGSSLLKGRTLYLPPEVIRKETHSEKAESWSFGVILYQMLHNGKFPYSDEKEIAGDQLPFIDPSLPQDLKDLLIELLQDPENRLTIYEARETLLQNLIKKL